jgi:hypothetical protein
LDEGQHVHPSRRTGAKPVQTEKLTSERPVGIENPKKELQMTQD